MTSTRSIPTIGELTAVLPPALHAVVDGDDDDRRPDDHPRHRLGHGEGDVRLPARRPPRRALLRSRCRRRRRVVAARRPPLAVCGRRRRHPAHRRRHPAGPRPGRRGGQRRSRRRRSVSSASPGPTARRRRACSSPRSFAPPATRRASSARCRAPTRPRRRRSCRPASPSSATEGDRSVVMEVSSHALALHRVDGTRFDAAVFTNLGRDHLDLHGTVEEYFRAKALLFQPGRAVVGVVNVDDRHGRLLVDAAPIEMVPFSIDDVSDVEVTASDGRLHLARRARLGAARRRVQRDERHRRGDDRGGDRDRHRGDRRRPRGRRTRSPDGSSG